MTVDRPRLTERTFPPYSYVPGHAPHPVSDPQGHMHGEEHEPAESLDSTAWQDSEEYLFGFDLFNHGFYWEAHEAWEALWHAAGRKGELANFFKGLIKLAAAAVKAREGNPRGVARHASRALELLAGIQHSNFCGLEMATVIAQGETLKGRAETFDRPQPELLLDLVLEPSAG